MEKEANQVDNMISTQLNIVSMTANSKRRQKNR